MPFHKMVGDLIRLGICAEVNKGEHIGSSMRNILSAFGRYPSMNLYERVILFTNFSFNNYPLNLAKVHR